MDNTISAVVSFTEEIQTIYYSIAREFERELNLAVNVETAKLQPTLLLSCYVIDLA